MKYTKQEIKNHKRFVLSFILFFLALTLIMIGIQKQLILFGIIGVPLIIFTQLWMFYIGYSQGWELKRLSGENLIK